MQGIRHMMLSFYLMRPPLSHCKVTFKRHLFSPICAHIIFDLSLHTALVSRCLWETLPATSWVLQFPLSFSPCLACSLPPSPSRSKPPTVFPTHLEILTVSYYILRLASCMLHVEPHISCLFSFSSNATSCSTQCPSSVSYLA